MIPPDGSRGFSGSVAAPLFPLSPEPAELQRAATSIARFCERQFAWNQATHIRVSELDVASDAYEKRSDQAELLMEKLSGKLDTLRAEQRRDRYWLGALLTLLTAVAQGLQAAL